MRHVDRVIAEARGRKVPDVDDVLVAPTVVGGQLYALTAEEKSISDALFILGRALDKGRIGPETFVKVCEFDEIPLKKNTFLTKNIG